MVEEVLVDARESRSGVELDDEEDANEFDDDGVGVVEVVEVVDDVDEVEEATDCVVEVGAVLETDSGVDVVDVATIGDDEGVEVLDEEACVSSVVIEEGVVLDVKSEDVDAATREDEDSVRLDEEEADDDD